MEVVGDFSSDGFGGEKERRVVLGSWFLCGGGGDAAEGFAVLEKGEACAVKAGGEVDPGGAVAVEGGGEFEAGDGGD